MIEENGQQRSLKEHETVLYLLFSIILNSFANALTITSDLGSAIWTASAVNLRLQLPFRLGTILFGYAVLVQILNLIIRREIRYEMVFANLLFAFAFSYFIQFWSSLLKGVMQLPFGWRLGLNLLGIGGTAIAISIYQRLSVMLHPNDELSYLIRFKYCHGSAALGQYLSYIIPIAVLIYCYLSKGKILSIGPGTFFALFFQGPLIGWADKIIFPKLKHRPITKIKRKKQN
ncbi:MAG: hypothetical protein ACRCZW_03205 [Lactobacillaceae bacterium]